MFRTLLMVGGGFVAYSGLVTVTSNRAVNTAAGVGAGYLVARLIGR